MGRRRGKRLTYAGLAIAMIALLGVVTSSSSARLGPPWQVQVSKHKDGPYVVPLAEANIPPGDTKNLYYKVKSQSDADYDGLRFDDSSSNPGQAGFRVKWFKGKTNITKKVRGNGYRFDLPGDESRRFRAKVRATNDAEQMCLTGRAGKELLGDAAGVFDVNGASCPS